MAGWVGLGCFFIRNAALQWRLCLAVQILAPLLLLVGSPWMPESPRWLCVKQRIDSARAILQKLHPIDQHPGSHHSLAETELSQICQQIEIERTESEATGWRRALTQKSFRKRMLYGFFVQYVVLPPKL